MELMRKLLLAFEALQSLVRVSGLYNEGDTIGCYEPFLLSNKSRKELVCFKIEFFTPDSTRYLYKIAFPRDCIEAGLPEPDFKQHGPHFVTTIWRARRI